MNNRPASPLAEAEEAACEALGDMTRDGVGKHPLVAPLRCAHMDPDAFLANLSNPERIAVIRLAYFAILGLT